MRILACGRWSGARAIALESLRGAGHEVLRCTSGAGPLECLLGPEPELLLLACDEGGRWAQDALRVVRRRRPGLRVLVVTADGSVQERLRLDAARPDFVLVDPLAAGELVEAIAALRRRKGSRSPRLSRRAAPTSGFRPRATRPGPA